MRQKDEKNMSRICSVAVIGAGTMGAQIAAHVANAGVPVLLLDRSAALAREGLDRARALKPDPFFTRESLDRIQIGTLDDISALSRTDWIIEAVIEDLEIKRDLLARIDSARGPETIVTSNTSGLSINELAVDRSPSFRAHWLGTHFFNPPRYLHLVEIMPTG